MKNLNVFKHLSKHLSKFLSLFGLAWWCWVDLFPQHTTRWPLHTARGSIRQCAAVCL